MSSIGILLLHRRSKDRIPRLGFQYFQKIVVFDIAQQKVFSNLMDQPSPKFVTYFFFPYHGRRGCPFRIDKEFLFGRQTAPRIGGPPRVERVNLIQIQDDLTDDPLDEVVPSNPCFKIRRRIGFQKYSKGTDDSSGGTDSVRNGSRYGLGISSTVIPKNHGLSMDCPYRCVNSIRPHKFVPC